MSKSIASLLTFAVTTSLALANGGEGDKKNPFQGGSNWKPGQGLQLAQGEDYSLNLSGQIQAGWAFGNNENAADTNSFEIPRARLAFTGHAVSKDLTYRLMLDGTDTTDGALKDGWAQWAFSKNEGSNLSLRMGQGLSGYGLESTGSETGLFFVERSTASRTFGQDRTRDQGAWVHGSHSENSIRWVIGAQNDDVANGSGFSAEGGANDDNELNYIGALSFDPMGDTTGGKGNESIMQGDLDGAKDVKGTIGLGYQLGNNRRQLVGGGNPTVDVESNQLNLNTAWMLGNGLTVQGEYFMRTDDVATDAEYDTDGYYVMGTYTLPKSGDSAIQWGFGARINMIDTDGGGTVPGLSASGTNLLGAGDVQEISLVANAFYHGHAAKTQIELTQQEASPDTATNTDSTNYIIRVQFQILF
jgi:phosphate-selective porin